MAQSGGCVNMDESSLSLIRIDTHVCIYHESCKHMPMIPVIKVIYFSFV